MQIWDAIVVGAGPAGLFAAINIEHGKNVLVIEKNASAGKKLLVTGAGQCNVSHAGDIMDFHKRYNMDGRYVRRALSLYTNDNLRKYLAARGVDTFAREDGKIFPVSLRAQDVLKALSSHLKELGREIRFGCSLLNMEKRSEYFVLETSCGQFRAHHVVLATGGITYPSLGSSGDGQRIVEKLGHRITPMKGALSPVEVRSIVNADLQGITLKNTLVTLYRDQKKQAKYCSDLLFTHRGLSGPVIIDHSRAFEVGDNLKIEIGVNIEDICKDKHLGNALSEHLPQRLAQFILSELGINPDMALKSISGTNRKKLERNLLALDFPIDSVGLLKDSMVTSGGVSFSDVQSKTLESRLVEGLHFAGEVLDIDGESGGYNLQAAFSTGYLCARSMND
jgi:predicted Rossmann fold flavoprotein